MADTVNAPQLDRDTMIEMKVDDYIASNRLSLPDIIDPNKPDARDIRQELLSDINGWIVLENINRGKGADALRGLQQLTGAAIAKLLIATGDVRRLVSDRDGYDIVAKRYVCRSGEYVWAGTWTICDPGNYANPLLRAFQRLSPNATSHDEKAFWRAIAEAPAAASTRDTMLIPWRNGVWDYTTQTFTAYDADDYTEKYGDKIFLAKLPVYHPYGPNAILKPDANGRVDEPVYHNDKDGTDWTPSSCLEDPFYMDTDMGKASNLVLWQLIQFTVRGMNGDPGVYHFWLDASGNGHNGKGTVWAMIRRLLTLDRLTDADDDLVSNGSTVITASIEDFDNPALLGPDIKTAYAICGEESDAATSYVKKCARFKNIARGQSEKFKVLYKDVFDFKYNGALIQQCNKFPKFNEKNDSVIKHILAIIFPKTFNDDRSYIKSDYVLREETAEWLAYAVTCILDPFTAYDREAMQILEPNCRGMLEESMPTFQFLDEVLPGLHMDYINHDLLFELYHSWCEVNNVDMKSITSKIFKEDLQKYASNNDAGITYTKDACRGSVSDPTEYHEAIETYGYAPRRGYIKYIDPNAYKQPSGNAAGWRGRLNPEMMLDKSRKRGKLWCGGGLKRDPAHSWKTIAAARAAELAKYESENP